MRYCCGVHTSTSHKAPPSTIQNDVLVWGTRRAREGESESAIGRKSLHSHIGYPQNRRARWAAARARAPASSTLNGELMMRARALDTTGHSRGRFFLFSLVFTDSWWLKAEVLEDAVVWNWTFRDAVSPVRSSAGSGFSFRAQGEDTSLWCA